MQQQLSTDTLRTVGRPTVIHDRNVALLCEALSRGFSIQAACNYANIDKSTFYRHVHSDPDFATKMTTSISFLYLAAADAIYRKIVYEKDAKLALKYLERVDPEKWAKTRPCRKCRNLKQKHLFRDVFFDAKIDDQN